MKRWSWQNNMAPIRRPVLSMVFWVRWPSINRKFSRHCKSRRQDTMEIFGIGASELVFIILIAIIVLGPRDMQKAGRTIGRFLNQLIRSDGWKVFQRTSNELRNLPRNLMREANMEIMEAEKDLHRVIDPRPNQTFPR